MSNSITNINASYQASASYQSASVTQTSKDGSSSLSASYESLEINASVTVEISGLDMSSQKALDTSSMTDAEKVKAMKEDLNNNVNALKQMVLKLLDTQSGVHSVATDNLHKLVNKITSAGGIDELAKSEAQALIAEDGYWGVNKTSERILDFAKAISGGDSSKIDLLRDAFQKGYDEAEKLWGGQLPDISKQTYDKVMEGFDAWAAESETAASAAETEE